MEQDNSHGDAGGSTPSPNTPSCLVDQFPEVAAEWHPTRNGERSPSWVTPGSKYRAWWLCSVCGSEWQARVGSRTRGHGCPSCGRELAGRSHAVPKPGTSLAEWFPDVAAEWHPTRNGDLTPDLVGYASNKKVWWRCRDCQHEWQIQVSNRSRGSSCRRCAHRTLGAPKPGNSLLERFPSISAEWHPSRNEAATPAGTSYGAKRRVWWQCANCGHEWSAAVCNRTNGGTGCPVCGNGSSPKPRERRRPEDDLAGASGRDASGVEAINRNTPQLGDTFLDRFPAAAAEWHPTKNEET